jgi:hypothetical protein
VACSFFDPWPSTAFVFVLERCVVGEEEEESFEGEGEESESLKEGSGGRSLLRSDADRLKRPEVQLKGGREAR